MTRLRLSPLQSLTQAVGALEVHKTMKVMTKGVAGLLLICAAALGLAQAQGVATHGRGVLGTFDPGSEVRRMYQFGFEVGKIVRDGHELIRGHFSLESQVGRGDAEGFSIIAREIGQLRVAGNEAMFQGPAVLRVRTARGFRTVPGSVRVVVQDNGVPANNEDPKDRLSVRFVSRDGDLVREIAGLVVRGDAAVRGG